MVKFLSNRMPLTSDDVVKNLDMASGKILVSAEKEHISSAIVYWLFSEEAEKYIRPGDEWIPQIQRMGSKRIVSTSLDRFNDTGSSDNNQSTDDALRVTIEPRNGDNMVTVRANIPQYIKNSVEGVQIYNTALIEESLLSWMKQKPRKVELGYGPSHIIDDIEPNALEPTYVPTDDREIVETFRRWMLQCNKRTVNMGVETAAYLDDNYNMIGVLEGGKHSVNYPTLTNDTIHVSIHTHPGLRNLALPSPQDISSIANLQPITAVSAIICSNRHYAFKDIGVRGDTQGPEKGEAEYPFDELPVTLVKTSPEYDEKEMQDHHIEQVNKAGEMAEQQIDQKMRAINEIDDDISGALYVELINEAGEANTVREKAIYGNVLTDAMDELGRENDIKFTIEQEVLQL